MIPHLDEIYPQSDAAATASQKPRVIGVQVAGSPVLHVSRRGLPAIISALNASRSKALKLQHTHMYVVAKGRRPSHKGAVARRWTAAEWAAFVERHGASFVLKEY